MTPPIKALRYYLLSGVIEGLLALAILLLIPADPKNAWVLGFSKSRLVMVIGLLAITVGFGWLTRTFGKKERHSLFAVRLAETAGNYPVFTPVMLFLYGWVLFGTYLYLVLAFQPLTTLQGVLTRIFPVVFFAITRLVQAIIVWVILSRQSRAVKVSETAQWLIQITPQKIATLLGGIAIFIILASVMLDVIEELTWAQKFWGFRVKFDLDQEANVPTYFSTLILMISAVLFAIIGMLKPPGKNSFAQHWKGLGLIFFFLSVDEAAVLHERFIGIFELYFKPTGIFYFGWVILAIPLVLIVAVAYFKFFLHLPTKMKILFVVSAFFYLAGAVGMEMAGGWFAENYGENRPFYNVITTVEEILEITGIITLIYALLLYIHQNFHELRFRVVDDQTHKTSEV
jgi:hypothetical protein